MQVIEVGYFSKETSVEIYPVVLHLRQYSNEDDEEEQTLHTMMFSKQATICKYICIQGAIKSPVYLLIST